MRAITLSLPFALLALACNAGTSTDSSDGSGGSGANGSSGTHSNGSSGTGFSASSGFGTGAGTGGNDNGCSAASQLVYVFTTNNEIYSFDPPTKQFTFVASPDCPTGSQANSMAIDRNLVAWINYIGGIYTFDLNTKTGCQLALTPPSQYQQVGMGFATDQANGTSETLYVDSISGSGLAKIDTATKQLTPINSFSGDQNVQFDVAELTGTGSARLFGYFTTFPNVRIAEIDKGTAAIISDHELAGVPPPSDWAFSFWGGDFYLYAAPGNNASGNSTVIRYRPSDQSVDTNYVPDTGFAIVGAGVSTCAPIIPPS
jgi:hypothetical protein